MGKGFLIGYSDSNKIKTIKYTWSALVGASGSHWHEGSNNLYRTITLSDFDLREIGIESKKVLILDCVTFIPINTSALHTILNGQREAEDWKQLLNGSFGSSHINVNIGQSEINKVIKTKPPISYITLISDDDVDISITGSDED